MGKVLEEAETTDLEATCKDQQLSDLSTTDSASRVPCSCRTGSLEAVPLCITQQQRDPASSGRLNTDLGFLLTAVNTPVEHILALVKVGKCVCSSRCCPSH